ncbi:MAG: hypothetical protein ACK5K7_06090 [Bacilli bacterium]
MEMKRHITSLIAAILMLIASAYSFIMLLTTDMNESIELTGVDLTAAEKDAAVQLAVGILVLFIIAFLISGILVLVGYLKRKPGLILVGTIICTLFILGNFVLSLPAVILGYIGFAKQKGINNDYKLLNDGLDSDY